jgi:multicomponent Na+:H+ antiporter subunit E
VLYLHVMDVRSDADIVSARRKVLQTEERVVRAFGSDAEVAALLRASALDAEAGR